MESLKQAENAPSSQNEHEIPELEQHNDQQAQVGIIDAAQQALEGIVKLDLGKAFEARKSSDQCDHFPQVLVFHDVVGRVEKGDLVVRQTGNWKIWTKLNEAKEEFWVAFVLNKLDLVDRIKEASFATVCFKYYEGLGKPALMDQIEGLKIKEEVETDNFSLKRKRRIVWTGEDIQAKKRKLEEEKLAKLKQKCGICDEILESDSDVGTWFDLTTRKLACSSSNTDGKFHVFHLHCLMSWILYYEFSKLQISKDVEKVELFCPVCHASLATSSEDELIRLREYKLEVINASWSWDYPGLEMPSRYIDDSGTDLFGLVLPKVMIANAKSKIKDFPKWFPNYDHIED